MRATPAGTQTSYSEYVPSSHDCSDPAKPSSIQVFRDLDIVLFKGRLQGNVYLRWTRSIELLGITHLQGQWHMSNGRVGRRIRISLNRRGLLLDARGGLEGVMAVLIHEMLHAYFFLCGGLEKSRDYNDNGQEVENGINFYLCVAAINNTLRRTQFRTATSGNPFWHTLHGHHQRSGYVRNVGYSVQR